MRHLSPLILKPHEVSIIDRAVQEIFDEVIYIPLLRILKRPLSDIVNSISALLDAVRRGDVWYEKGSFTGTYTAQVSKELQQLGAKFNRFSKTWELSAARIPPAITFALSEAQSRYDSIRREMLTVLGDVSAQSISQQRALEDKYEDVLDQLEFDFRRTIAGHDLIAIPAQFTPEMREEIASDWAENLDLYIKSWSDENILKLREEIESPILTGGRAASLQAVIARNYAVSKAKAKFLAHQETSLLLSKYREARYKSIGVRRYTWRGAMDQRERPDHKELEGKVFDFKSPPVTNRKTGARHNPGEDWGCRCLAVPLVE